MTRLGCPPGVPWPILAAVAWGAVASPIAAQEDVAATAIRTLLGVWESGEVATLDGLFHDDAVYVDMPNGRELAGLSEIRGYVEHVHGWASEVTVEVRTVRSSDEFAVAEWLLSGVQDRPIEGMISEATGRGFEIGGTTLIDLEDGRIVKAVDYIQVVPLMLQLGARIELPGGVVLGSGAGS